MTSDLSITTTKEKCLQKKRKKGEREEKEEEEAKEVT